MLEAQRHNLIRDLLDEYGTISLRKLVEEIGASEATLRRDLIKLAEIGALKQVRGGATLTLDNGVSRRNHLAGSAFIASLEREVDAKRAIARHAVDLCDDEEAIIINGGSTTYYMAEFLRDRSMTILTNSFALGLSLIESSENRVVFPAGEAHRKLSFILNPLEDKATDSFRASKYFLSAYGVSEKGIVEADPLVAQAEQRLGAQASEIILLVDNTKIGRSSGFSGIDLSQIDKVITDDRLKKKDQAIFEKRGIEVVKVLVGNQSSRARSA